MVVLPLLLFLPLGVWADGMVFPTIAYPARVTIPDQQAALSFSNGVERLVIETRFAGAGSNFAWVVPLPSQPVIEAATPGFFPTLRFLCRPEVRHEVPRFFAGILALIGILTLVCTVRPTGRIQWLDIVACLCVGVAATANSEHKDTIVILFLFVETILFCDVLLIRLAEKPAYNVFAVTFVVGFCLFSMLLPAGLAASKSAVPASPESVSILERKIVGIFETTTIASPDANALQIWLTENGYALPTNAAPVIASYAKAGWVFVASKIHRENDAPASNTPHPLSFTFKTRQPVYPMRLTGLSDHPLKLDLYVLGDTSATAAHCQVEYSLRQDLHHALLQQWFGDSAVITKLSTTLSPADMNEDVWVRLSAGYAERRATFYSQQGAEITALNWGAFVFGIGLLVITGVASFSVGCRARRWRLIGFAAILSMAGTAIIYTWLPQIEVNLVKGRFRHFAHQEMQAVRLALRDQECRTPEQVRATLQAFTSNPTNATDYGLKNWDNEFVGGPFREEDSPGNYLMRGTNKHVKLILINPDGSEMEYETLDLPLHREN